MPDLKASPLVRCMHGADDAADVAGGIAIVRWLDDVHPEQLIATARSILASQKTAHTSVFVAGGQGCYVAESFSSAGARIQFCGHGALAAAWVVFNEHAIDAGRLEFSNARYNWRARSSADDVNDITLTYKKPLLVDCPVPDFATACLGAQPVAAAEVGGVSDYFVLELAGEDAVRQLNPDFAAISAATGRALIVTARANNDGCVFRYFAPQYGDPEDAATGSAAVQLAAYWSPRLNAETFAARQLSPQGARMQLGCHGGVVELAARVGYR